MLLNALIFSSRTRDHVPEQCHSIGRRPLVDEAWEPSPEEVVIEGDMGDLAGLCAKGERMNHGETVPAREALLKVRVDCGRRGSSDVHFRTGSGVVQGLEQASGILQVMELVEEHYFPGVPEE
jgi:hypothetical protein